MEQRLLVEVQLVLGRGLVGRGGVGGERVRPQVGRGSGAVEKGGVQRFWKRERNVRWVSFIS